MFQDEAGFGRINKPKYCWCKKGYRPSVPCHHIREYRYVYGAVEPLTGESCFLVMPYCNTTCMNIFLAHLSESYKDDQIVLVCDGAAWHKSNGLSIPDNIHIVFIPPYTPEMNPIEQIWKEIRKIGFRNEVFQTLQKVIDTFDDLSRFIAFFGDDLILWLFYKADLYNILVIFSSKFPDRFSFADLPGTSYDQRFSVRIALPLRQKIICLSFRIHNTISLLLLYIIVPINSILLQK